MWDKAVKQVISDIRSNIDSREIVIYGAGVNGEKLVKLLSEEFPGRIAFFVDAKADNWDLNEVCEHKIKSLAAIKKQTNEYYIAVSVGRFDKAIKDKLLALDYYETIDYSYHPEVYGPVIVNSPCDYQDEAGNRVVGCLEGAEIVFNGCNSEIIVGENVICSNLKVWLHSDVKIQIGNNSSFGRWSWKYSNPVNAWILQNDSFLTIGNNVEFFEGGVLECGVSGICAIGDGSSIRNNYHIICQKDDELIIGRDFMGSFDVVIFSSDAHEVRNNNTGECINYVRGKNKLSVGEHVWIGYRATVMGKGTSIGNNCVIGASSFVRKSIPDNCVAAGVPAKVIRTDVDW